MLEPDIPRRIAGDRSTSAAVVGAEPVRCMIAPATKSSSGDASGRTLCTLGLAPSPSLPPLNEPNEELLGSLECEARSTDSRLGESGSTAMYGAEPGDNAVGKLDLESMLSLSVVSRSRTVASCSSTIVSLARDGRLTIEGATRCSGRCRVIKWSLVERLDILPADIIGSIGLGGGLPSGTPTCSRFTGGPLSVENRSDACTIGDI